MMIVLLPMLLYHPRRQAVFDQRRSRRQRGPALDEVSAGIVLFACLIFYLLPRPASSIMQHGLAQRTRMNFHESVDLRNNGPDENDTTVVMRIIWSSGSPPDRFYLSGARLEGATPDGFMKKDSPGVASSGSGAFTDRMSMYPASLYSENVFFPFRLSRIVPGSVSFQGSNVVWMSEPPPAYEVWVNRSPGQENPCSTDLPLKLRSVGYLGKRIAADGDPAAKAGRIAAYLKSGYRYTLKNDRIPPGSSSIEWFVFTGKRGRCEHFAAASAVMLRGCGIPARVVTGFLVDEYNGNGDYYIVRASNAHAWVEYWDGAWQILDATPSQGAGTAAIKPLLLLDELRFRWYRWVIQFSLDDQIQFASKIFTPSPIIARQVESWGLYALYLIFSVLVALGGFSLFKRSLLHPYEKVSRALRKKKLVLPPNSSHQEHARMVSEKYPSLGPFFREYLGEYLAWRFGKRDIDIKKSTGKIIREIKTRAGKNDTWR